jgi:hypothetical protein
MTESEPELVFPDEDEHTVEIVLEPLKTKVSYRPGSFEQALRSGLEGLAVDVQVPPSWFGRLLGESPWEYSGVIKQMHMDIDGNISGLVESFTDLRHRWHPLIDLRPCEDTLLFVPMV